MPHPATADLGQLIAALCDGGVNFVIVGGAAAVLHGAPVTTLDLDIVPEQTPPNVSRLLSTLQVLDARIRDPAGRDLMPDEALLFGQGQILLTTSLGPLDVLCRLHDGRGYAQLLPGTIELQDGGRRIRILELADLIAIKISTGRARDKLVVPVLVALLRKKASNPD
jgi:predicted nucleotidyltransferase